MANSRRRLGVCGGDCPADSDNDGICDTDDECLGELDACGICNGPGAIYDCGCSDIPEGDCDCNGSQWTPSMSAAERAVQTRTQMAFVTM